MDNTKKPLRDKFGHFTKKTVEPVVKQSIPVKRGISKRETIGEVAKENQIKDEKPDFVMSKHVVKEIIHPILNRKDMADLNKFIDEKTVQSKIFTDKRQNTDIKDTHPLKIKQIPVESPYKEPEYLRIYRVYSGVGTGYRYIISVEPPKSSQAIEPVMTLREPRVDLIALERAIKKYRG